jgi:hypothetical protein
MWMVSCCHDVVLQVMFGLGKSIAAQDPSYPVYVDTSVMMGNTGLHNGKGFDNIEYMVCTPENNFFPDLAKVSRTARVTCTGAHTLLMLHSSGALPVVHVTMYRSLEALRECCTHY